MPKYVITNDDLLYRRFPIIDEPKFAVFWKLSNGRKVPSSAAFKTKRNEDGLSVDISALTSPENTAGDTNIFGVAELPASVPISLGYQCLHNPQKGNDAHALIVGDTNPIAKKLSNAVSKIFTFDAEGQ